jgi:hypothetical protein
LEILLHFRHGKKNGKALMQLPEIVASHVDEKRHKLAFHLGRNAGIDYVRHKAFSLPKLPSARLTRALYASATLDTTNLPGEQTPARLWSLGGKVM